MKIFLQKNTISDLLSALSLVVVFSLLFFYILGSFLAIDAVNRIFEKAQERSFIWYLLIFVILCNLNYIRDIIKSAVRDKVDSLVVSDIREEVKRSIENDPDMLKKLKKAQDEKEKHLFSNKPINPNK